MIFLHSAQVEEYSVAVQLPNHCKVYHQVIVVFCMLLYAMLV